jgi:ATP-dependent RNA helicase DeaD
VIHYRIPDEQNTYTHRSGRTGRAGKKGISLVIIHAREKFKLERIETILGKTFKNRPIPSAEEIGRNQLQYHLNSSDVTEASLDEIFATLETLSASEKIDAQMLMDVRKTMEYYRVTPELSSEPEKIRPRNKTAGSISGREARENHVPREMTEGMIELVVNVGKRNELSEEGLRELMNGCGSAIEFGRINIVDMQTYFEVPYPLSHEVINHFKQNPTEFGGRPINVAFAGNAKPVDSKRPNPRGVTRGNKKY